MGGDFRIDTEIGESDDGEDEAELGDANAGIAHGIEDEPTIGEPRDFGEN